MTVGVTPTGGSARTVVAIPTESMLSNTVRFFTSSSSRQAHGLLYRRDCRAKKSSLSVRRLSRIIDDTDGTPVFWMHARRVCLAPQDLDDLHPHRRAAFRTQCHKKGHSAPAHRRAVR